MAPLSSMFRYASTGDMMLMAVGIVLQVGAMPTVTCCPPVAVSLPRAARPSRCLSPVPPARRGAAPPPAPGSPTSLSRVPSAPRARRR